MGRRASDIMGARGEQVVVASPQESLHEVVGRLARRGVGAVVVVDEDRTVLGVLSERDVVQRLAETGAACLDELVADVMTSPVTTCRPDVSTDELMGTMTEGRFRHVPVVRDGRLEGIVSVGDVVKARIDELAVERDQLQDYVADGY